MNEKDIEKYVVAYARAKGVYARKFTSPAHRSVPDDLFIYGGLVWFIEFKAPGKKATENQLREMQKIEDVGVNTFVCDDRAKGKLIIDLMINESKNWRFVE